MLEEFTVDISKTTAAVEAAIAKWAINAFNLVQNEIRKNITGKVLHGKPGGKLFQSIQQVGRVKPRGFVVGTNVFYGIAWEFGFKRKGYVVAPAPGRPYESKEYAPILPYDNPRARVKFNWGGATVFARSTNIKPRTFKARPFIRPAIEDNLKKITDMLSKEIAKPLSKVANAKIVMDVRRTQ